MRRAARLLRRPPPGRRVKKDRTVFSRRPDDVPAAIHSRVDRREVHPPKSSATNVLMSSTLTAPSSFASALAKKHSGNWLA